MLTIQSSFFPYFYNDRQVHGNISFRMLMQGLDLYKAFQFCRVQKIVLLDDLGR